MRATHAPCKNTTSTGGYTAAELSGYRLEQLSCSWPQASALASAAQMSWQMFQLLGLACVPSPCAPQAPCEQSEAFGMPLSRSTMRDVGQSACRLQWSLVQPGSLRHPHWSRPALTLQSAAWERSALLGKGCPGDGTGTACSLLSSLCQQLQCGVHLQSPDGNHTGQCCSKS